MARNPEANSVACKWCLCTSRSDYWLSWWSTSVARWPNINFWIGVKILTPQRTNLSKFWSNFSNLAKNQQINPRWSSLIFNFFSSKHSTIIREEFGTVFFLGKIHFWIFYYRPNMAPPIFQVEWKWLEWRKCATRRFFCMFSRHRPYADLPTGLIFYKLQ